MRELQKSLREGAASVRDHDEDGKSLLFYAARKPELCKFLIECGLDVDHVAPLDSEPSSGNSTPLYLTTRGYSEGPNVLERVDKCQKLLLEAGADPSIDLSSAGGVLPSWTPFNNILARGSISSAEVFLDYGKHFIDIEIRDIDGKTPLLQSSEGRYTSIHHSAAFLLQRGANVHALDFKGDSCLHMALRGSKGPDYFNSEFKLLVMLVKAGVDVYRRNMAGVSVSETAYHRSPMGPWVDNCGSYFGDLWHRVLAECGYQVSDFRQQSPRTGRYTTEHPRE